MQKGIDLYPLKSIFREKRGSPLKGIGSVLDNQFRDFLLVVQNGRPIGFTLVMLWIASLGFILLVVQNGRPLGFASGH